MFHKLCVVSLAVSLLPIVMGTLVTSLGAGMAFPDWPTSDGQGMFAYPWLQSSGHKFVEHGHRLAGALIGLCSVAVVVIAWVQPVGQTERRIACGLLIAVVIQGLLGGLRVRLDRQAVAVVHSIMASVVFSLLWILCIRQSRWFRQSFGMQCGWWQVTLVAVLCQYLLGAAVRHLGHALGWHLAGAVAVTTLVMVSWLKSGIRGRALVGMVVVIQCGLGLLVWTAKYGMPHLGIVAVQQSAIQLVSRTSHSIVAMFLVAVLLGLCVIPDKEVSTASRGLSES